MVRPDVAKWDQTLADLRRLSLEAEHVQTRERFQALYMIASDLTTATQWAQQIGRCAETVLRWVHIYNKNGPGALRYRRSRRHAPLFPRYRLNNLPK